VFPPPPPDPTTILVFPAITGKDPVKNPPAPPPPAQCLPPPPPPAITKYSTGPELSAIKVLFPTVVNVCILYPPKVVIDPPVEPSPGLEGLPNGLILPRIVVIIGI
jgi:hypothetical protein